tara:strand:+ start:1389 stop:1700 length:312 start_codon:yes stop_codon:yes gene_type:complete
MMRHSIWQKQSALKHEDTEQAQGVSLQKGRHLSMPWDNVQINITFGIADKRRRDLDNLTTKGFLDGLVHADVLTDDSMRVIKRISIGWEYADTFYTDITVEAL